MPLVLDPTVGGPNSNSYIDLGTAESLIAAVPNAGAWTSVQDDQVKIQALLYATTMLESIAWEGVKTGSQASQALAWPRAQVPDPDYGSTDQAWMGFNGLRVYLDFNAIPKRMQRAEAMLALEVLRAGGSDVWGVDDTRNMASDGVSVLRTTYIDDRRRILGLRRYPSVWREIYPLTRAAQGLTVERA